MMKSYFARFFLDKDRKRMEKIYLIQTIENFLERYEDSPEKVFKTYIERKTKDSTEYEEEKIKVIQKKIKRARESGKESLANLYTMKLNKYLSKASKIYSIESIVDALSEWIEQSGFKSVYEKLGFIIELPPIKGYDKTWKVSTIHPYSYGVALPDENTKLGKLAKKIKLSPFLKKRVEPCHIGDLEEILLMERKGVFYARQGSVHGYYSHRDTKLGECYSFEDIFKNWIFNFYPGDHSVRIVNNNVITNKIKKLLEKNKDIVKLIPFDKKEKIEQLLTQYSKKDLEPVVQEIFNSITPKFEIIDYITVKELFGFNYFDFVSEVFKLDELMKQELTKENYKKCKKLIWGTSLKNYEAIETELKSFSDKFEIQDMIGELYNLRANLRTKIDDKVNKCWENPRIIDKVLGNKFKDLPQAAKLSLLYSIENLLDRPLVDVYRENASFKKRFVSSFLGAYLFGRAVYKGIRGWNKRKYDKKGKSLI